MLQFGNEVSIKIILLSATVQSLLMQLKWRQKQRFSDSHFKPLTLLSSVIVVGERKFNINHLLGNETITHV